MQLIKTDSNGNFLPFPGVTIISEATASAPELFENIERQLTQNKIISECFAILPASSYHMTTLNLFTQEEISPDRLDFFLQSRSDLFLSLKTAINKNLLIKTRITGYCIGGAIQIQLCLPRETENLLQEIAENHCLIESLPTFFHITLAYQYRPLNPLYQQAINRQLSSIFKNLNLIDHELSLPSPKLSFFYDMTAFQEWDGVKSLSELDERCEPFFEDISTEEPHCFCFGKF